MLRSLPLARFWLRERTSGASLAIFFRNTRDARMRTQKGSAPLSPSAIRFDKLRSMGSRETLKRIDILRHELKALRFILDHFHCGKPDRFAIPPREDFQSEQGRLLYDAIIGAPTRVAAEEKIGELELDDVDIESFLRLSGEHYYTYPALVRERAEAIRAGRLKVENQ